MTGADARDTGRTGQPGLFTATLPVEPPSPREFAARLRRDGFGAHELCLVAYGIDRGWVAELAGRLGEFVHVPAPGYVIADAVGGIRLKGTEQADETVSSWESFPPWPGARPRFVDHQDRLLPHGLEPNVELAEGLVPTAEFRERLRALAPAEPATSYLRDHALFDAAAYRVAHRVRAGLPPLETEYQRLIGDMGELITRGVEIEFHAGLGSRTPDGELLSTPEIDKIAALLEGHGLARDARVRRHGEGREPGGGQPYSEDADNWRVELEEAEGDGEVVSPIFRDTPQAYADLGTVCETIRVCGGHTSPRAGGHVHVGVPFGTDVGLHRKHLARFYSRQWLYFRLGTSIRQETHRGPRFCEPLPVPPEGATRIRQLRDHFKRRLRHPALKIARSVGRRSDSVEYRQGDASLDAAEWWIRSTHFAADVLLTLITPDDRPLPRPHPMTGDGSRASAQKVLAAVGPVQVHAPEPPGDTIEIRKMLDEYPWPRLRRSLAEIYHLTPPYRRRRPTPDPAEIPPPYDVAAMLGLPAGAEITDEHRRWLVAVLDRLPSTATESPEALDAGARQAIGPRPTPVVELGHRLRAWEATSADPDLPPHWFACQGNVEDSAFRPYLPMREGT